MTGGEPQSSLAPRRRLLARGGGIVAGLSYYNGGAAQAEHTHENNQISFLLLGSMQERQGERCFEPVGGWIGFKPAGCVHADRFGADGALLLTIETPGGESITQAGWSVQAERKSVAALIRLAADASGSSLALDAVEDLLSTAANHRGRADGSPPKALSLARARLDEEPEQCRIDALAVSVGIERTSFAHLFSHHFGVAPSIYRARRMAAKASRALLDGSRTVADAALAGGFADHAHFTNTLRRLTGLSPSQLLALRA